MIIKKHIFLFVSDINMAFRKNWNRQKPKHIKFDTSIPSERISESYSGPYPKKDLAAARGVLIHDLRIQGSAAMEAAKYKAGAPSTYNNGNWDKGDGVDYSEHFHHGIPGTNSQNISIISNTKAEGPEKSDSRKRKVITPEALNKNPKRSKDLEDGELKEDDDADEESDETFEENDTEHVTLNGPTHKICDVYKCDFCDHMTRHYKEMDQHLKTKLHFSASQYKARKGEGKTKENWILLNVRNKLAIKNTTSNCESLVVVCPECFYVYSDIFVCGQHYTDVHGGVQGYYSICPLKQKQTCLIKADRTSPICTKCEQEFPKLKILKNHYKKFPDHLPYKESKDSIFIFECPYCKKKFINDFFNARSHLLDQHVHTNGKKKTLGLTVKTVAKITKAQSLPNQENPSLLEEIQDQLSTYCRLYKQIPSKYNKALRRNMRHTKNELKRAYTLVASGKTHVSSDFSKVKEILKEKIDPQEFMQKHNVSFG
ncbi:unnamed protein product [Owenia fusiformis]|uniref:Uncharacterized protein n=1 Tax=Owenia fusiformis TaxID=6347 RepID=A0A8J1UP75_OWEFU|nr:unnamed protein product [Owenia fusiformis]